MSYNFQNLLEPENKAIGISEKVLVAPLEWFTKISQPLDSGALITLPHRLTGNKSFVEMFLQPEKNILGAKSVGEKGTQRSNAELKVFLPGLYAQSIDQVAHLVNKPLIILQPDCGLGADYQLGNNRCFGWISAESVTGTTASGFKGFNLTITYAGPTYIYKPDTTILTVAGGNGSGSALNQLNYPAAVIVDSDLNVYVSDQGMSSVVKWAPDATEGIVVVGVHGTSGNNTTHIGSPWGIAFDNDGNLIVVDHPYNRVVSWAPDATEGVDLLTGLSSPTGLAVLADGTIFVAQAHEVRKFVTGDAVGVVVAGGHGAGSALNKLDTPTGLFVTADETVYVCDSTNNRVVKWVSGATTGVVVAGGNGLGDAANQLANPNGVFVDGDGNIYVADTNANRVQFWAPGATEGHTVAGGTGAGSAMDQLSAPLGVYVDASGYIYVADINNHRVQRWPIY